MPPGTRELKCVTNGQKWEGLIWLMLNFWESDEDGESDDVVWGQEVFFTFLHLN